MEKKLTAKHTKVVAAATLGTIFEWYDFYLFGSLAVVIGAHFFSPLPPATRDFFALLAFAVGFLFRPFGALVFGRLGDMVGRKYTFLTTIIIMGGATFLVGLIPSYETIGIAAPIILITLRILQGLALGGEYGGAAVYVAEHAPSNRKGLFTSFIQTTGTLGLLSSLFVIVITRTIIGAEAFASWGWRIPFLLSSLLLIISIYIRLIMEESPIFQQMLREKKTSSAPITESFLQWQNAKWVLLALFGLTAGQAVMLYAEKFYTLIFLTNSLNVDTATAQVMFATALIIATPGFIFFGWLSDKIGRKWLIMTGYALSILFIFPIYKGITYYANPALANAQKNAMVTVLVDKASCSLQLNVIGTATFTSACDIAKQTLTKNSVSYKEITGGVSDEATVTIGDTIVSTKDPNFAQSVKHALKTAGYPEQADPNAINKPMVILLLIFSILLVTMFYGPIAAALVEMFPARIRYSSLSLPYHLGTGWFGGFLPAISFAIVVETGNIYNGLWYPVLVASITLIIGVIFLPNKPRFK